MILGKSCEQGNISLITVDLYSGMTSNRLKKLAMSLSFAFLLFFMLPVQAQDAVNDVVNDVVSSGVMLEQQVFEIARTLRCPTCRAESAADSNSAISIQFRNIIQEKLEEGQSEKEIIAFFQASYGDWILLDPPKRGLHLIVWIAPLIAAVLALIIFFVLLRRWISKANAAPVALSAEELEKVRVALAKEQSGESA